MARNERQIVVVNLVDSSVTGTNDSTSITLISGSNIYTKSVYVGDGEYFGMSAILVSTAITPIEISFILEQSFRKPSVEGSYDATFVTTLSQSPTLVSIGATATWLNSALTLLPMPYARYKINCGAAMSAGAVKAQINVCKQVNG